MRFTDAYAQPLCSPTRACLLTGKAAARHGITSATGHQPPQPAGHNFLPKSAPANRAVISPESKNYLDPSEYTLAQALADAGWRTGHIGKWHLGLTEPYWPDKRGFQTAVHAHPDPGPPSYFSPYGFRLAQSYPDGPPGEYLTDRLTDEAVKFITENSDKPFFLNLWHHGVHGPWGHKEEYTKAFAAIKDPTGKQGNPIMASMLQSVDESFGRILETLDRLKLTENTIVIFNSDNGGNVHSNVPGDEKRGAVRGPRAEQTADWRKWAGDLPPTSNDPLRAGKGTLYEGGVRVPLMWAWPGHIQPNSISAEVVGAIDLYPTLLDLLQVAAKPTQVMDGLSYAAVLQGHGKLTRAGYFNFFPHGSPGKPGGATVRAGDWKLIRWFETGPKNPSLHELYNLRDDLGETRNLAAEQPERVQELDALISAFLRETHALTPIPNPAYQARPAGLPAAAPASGRSAVDSADPLQGWKARGCEPIQLADGLRLEMRKGGEPFLGTGQVRHEGPGVLIAKVRTPAGGQGKVQWRTADQADLPPPEQTVSYSLPPSAEWQELKIELPIKGMLALLRFYLPPGQPLDLGSIHYLPTRSEKPVRVWNFGSAK